MEAHFAHTLLLRIEHSGLHTLFTNNFSWVFQQDVAILAVGVSQCAVLIDTLLVVLGESLSTGTLEQSIQVSELFALGALVVSHLTFKATVVAEFTGCLCCTNTFVVAIDALASGAFLHEVVGGVADCAGGGCGFTLLAFW